MPGPSNLKSNTTEGRQEHLGDSMAENTPVLGRKNLHFLQPSILACHTYTLPSSHLSMDVHVCTSLLPCLASLASLPPPCLPSVQAPSRHADMQTCRHADMQTCTHADGCRPPACIAACIAGRNHGRKQITPYYNTQTQPLHQERPYHVDRTTSRPLCEVKRRRARLVLRWGTTWEALVLFLF